MYFTVFIAGLIIVFWWFIYLKSSKKGGLPRFTLGEICHVTWNLFFVLKPEDRLDYYASYISKYPTTSYMSFFGYNVLFSYDPEMMKRIFNSPVCIDRPIVEFLKLDKGIASMKTEDWKVSRRHLNPAFNLNILKEYIPLFVEIADKTIKEMEIFLDGKEFDLFRYVGRIEVRSVMATTVNVKGMEIPYEEVSDALDSLSEIVYYRIVNPFLHPDFIYRRTSLYKRETKLREFCYKLGGQLIRNAREINSHPDNAKKFQDTKIKPLVDLLLNDKDVQYTDEEIRDQVYIFLITGGETSAILLSNCMLFLAIHQDIQNQLYEEIMKNLPTIDTEVNYEILNQMDLLDRVVKEGLRLGSPLGITLRLTTDDFDTGYEIVPKGTRLVLYNFLLHKRKDIWGQDANTFNPDRFLPENVAKRHPYSFVPYGMGNRNCIGHRHAAFSTKTFIIRLLQHYKFSSTLKAENLKFIFSFTQRLCGGHMVSIERRQL